MARVGCWALAIGGTCGLAGCSGDVSKPRAPRYAVAGHVRISGRMADETNNPLGTLVVGDAEGLRVHLLKPGGAVDSTLTHAGRYEFGDLEPGAYRVSAWVVRAESIVARDVVVAGANVVVSDTLQLVSTTGVQDYPNPFPFLYGVGVEFTTSQPQHVEVDILSLAGDLVWSYAYDAVPGINHTHWIGDDAKNLPVPPGPYWAVARYDNRAYYNLVMKLAS